MKRARSTRRRRLSARVWVPVGLVAVAALVAISLVVVAPSGGDVSSGGDDQPATTDGSTATDDAGDVEGDLDAQAADDADPDEPAAPTDLQVPVPPVPGQLVNPASSGHMWSAEVPGLLTFRGNPTRSYYGQGPVPGSPAVAWTYPAQGSMCSPSTVGSETKTWCGTGWTGQPAVFEREGRTWLVFGAYDRAVHFMDALTGEEILPPFPTGDIIKGSVTIDPDGYPIVYIGSRDNRFRAIAFDRPGEAVELWSLSADAVSPTLWNNDWDGSALVLEDYLLEGGENSQFHMVKLNRGYGPSGEVTVDPQLVFNTPSWDDQVIADLAGNRAREMSIESSVAVSGNTVYFTNSGGLLSGWDLTPLLYGTGAPVQTLRFFTGDDTDASVVIDSDGFLYVAVEYERSNSRAAEVGQLMKLDPRNPENPIVWSYHDRGSVPAGFWATPALYEDVVINATTGGKLFALDRGTGAERWNVQLPDHSWQSPVVVDDTLVYGDCNGVLRGYDVSDTASAPPLRWEVTLGGCIESTPAVWKGRIYVGTRIGRVFALADPVG